MTSENLPNQTPIMIAYDGSADSRAAIDHAARLFPGAVTVILYTRQPLESVAAHLEGPVGGVVMVPAFLLLGGDRPVGRHCLGAPYRPALLCGGLVGSRWLGGRLVCAGCAECDGRQEGADECDDSGA